MSDYKFKRLVAANTSSFDEAKRTISGTFSSTTPYLREFENEDGSTVIGWEILGHRAADIDMSYLQVGAAFCFQHNLSDIRGVVDAYELIDGERMVGQFRFARTSLGEEAMGLVSDGIMRQLSVGYTLTGRTQIGEHGGYPVFYCTWKPHEVSLVTAAADVAMSGIGRAANEADETPLKELFTRALAETLVQPASKPGDTETQTNDTASTDKPVEVSQDNAQEAGTALELERVATLQSLGRALDAEAFAEKCIADGFTPDQFTAGVEAFKRDMAIAKQTKTKGNKKMEKFDLGRAFMNLHSGKSEGLEGETSAELAQKLARAGMVVSNTNAILVPSSALARSQTMGVATSGGNLLEQAYLPGQTVTPLHPAYVMDQLGITRLNLSKSARFSKFEGNPFFLWNAAGASNTRASRETAALTQTGFSTSTDTLTPVRGGTYFEFSDQLGMELDPSFIEMCKTDLQMTIALEEQRVMFKGNGVNEPKGLEQRAIQAVLGASGIPTRDELLSMKAKIAGKNGIPGKFLMSATMLYKLMGIAVGTAGKFLVEDNMTLLGTPVVVSNQIPDNEIWCAQWDAVMWADFGVMQIEIVSDADLRLHGMNRYQVSLFADTNCKRESFVVKGVFGTATV